MSATVAGQAPNEATRRAQQDTVLTRRFYTTDFEAMDRMGVDNIRKDWNALMAEFERDDNRGHFQRPRDMEADYSKLPPGLYEEFTDLLISSVTSEFSGCVLYTEFKKRLRNPDLRMLFDYMARDEARHAGLSTSGCATSASPSTWAISRARRSTRTSSRSSSSTPRISRRRSATRATSPSTGRWSATRSCAFTRSSCGSRSGATTNIGMARRSR